MTYQDDPHSTSDDPPHIVWRKLPFSDAPLGRQFALSESMLATLQNVPVPAFRWYAPRETALAVGNGQPLVSVDMAACQARGVAVYRRSSGGTAVLVDDAAFSLDLALPFAHPLATSDVTLAYRWVGEMMAEAMRNLGLAEARAIATAEARALAPLARDDPLRLACYGTLSPWEVVIPPAAGAAPPTPRKVVGLCQVRRRGGALFQVGFYRHFDAPTLAALLAIPDDARTDLATRLAEATAGLHGAAPRRHPYATEQIMRIIEDALTQAVGSDIEDGDWTEAELATADRLERERFGRLA